MQFLLNFHSCTHRITAGTREDALGRASEIAKERQTVATLAVEQGEGKERRAINLAVVNREGKIRFFPGWDELEIVT